MELEGNLGKYIYSQSKLLWPLKTDNRDMEKTRLFFYFCSFHLLSPSCPTIRKTSFSPIMDKVMVQTGEVGEER